MININMYMICVILMLFMFMANIHDVACMFMIGRNELSSRGAMAPRAEHPMRGGLERDLRSWGFLGAP